MELSQIKYFIMAARTQNLSKAAQLLSITQPALSKSIANLEEEMGVRLFDRSGKKIALNERGKVFYEYALNSVQELDNAVSAAKNKAAADPALNIGMFHHSERFLECVSMFYADNPDVVIQLEYMEIASQNIDTDQFDAILYPRNPLFRKYKGDVAYSDNYYLAVHKSNPLAGSGAVRLNDLTAQKLIVIKHDNKMFDLPYLLNAGAERRVTGAIFTNSYEIQRWLISNDRGVGFVPQGAAGAYAADSGIALIPLADEGFSREILIGFKREKHLSVDGRRFAAFARDFFNISE